MQLDSKNRKTNQPPFYIFGWFNMIKDATSNLNNLDSSVARIKLETCD